MNVLRVVIPGVLFILVFGLARAASVGDLAAGGQVNVSEIVDGDTVVLEDGRQVRLVGIQAPKLPLGRKNFTKWPLADMARDLLEELVAGREVTLRYGGQRVDRHGRALAHLVRDDGLWIQGELLSRGLARVYSFADNRALVAEMLEQEVLARAARKGIWANPWYAVRGPEGLARYLGAFQIVEGKVVDAAEVRGTVYLNFGADWRTDFTVMLNGKSVKLFRKAGIEPLELEGANIRVRGWLDNRNGPMIVATHPEQIEILE